MFVRFSVVSWIVLAKSSRGTSPTVREGSRNVTQGALPNGRANAPLCRLSYLGKGVGVGTGSGSGTGVGVTVGDGDGLGVGV